MKKIVLLSLLIIPMMLFARQHEEPKSLIFGLLQKNSMETIQLPAVDVTKSLDKHEYKTNQAKPLRFAHPNTLKITTKSNGQWRSVPGGEIWQLRFTSKNATDMNFGISEFQLPKGVELHFLSFADNPVYFDGPYTSEDNRSHKELWSAPLPGGDVGLELFVPDGVSKDFMFKVTQVSTGFRDVFKRYGGGGLSRGGSGACNNDVVCPVGDDWRDEIRSAAAYTIGGTDTCSGTMIMDAERSFRPFFLTAFHCGLSAGNAASIVTLWNYQSANCGDQGGGSRMDSISGSTFLASRSDTDSSLIELSSNPPESYGVHWAGWDITGNTPLGSVGIHHPGVSEKMISFNTDALTTVNNCIGGGGTDTHWEVDNWEDGTTEGGSSGSGIWDPDNKRLVGMLSGGTASCSSITFDCYGKFSEAWDNGGPDNQNLKPWLDPNDTGITGIDGSDEGPYAIIADNASIVVCSPDDAVYDLTLSQNDPGFNEVVTLTTVGLPGSATDSFSTDMLTPPGSSTLTISAIGTVTAGNYLFDVEGSSTSDTIVTALELIVNEGVPSAVSLTAPTDGSTAVPIQPTFTWSADPNAASYLLEVATDDLFSNIVVSEVVTDTTFSVSDGLASSTDHYWRVTSQSACGNSVSAEFMFTTNVAPGDCPAGTSQFDIYSFEFQTPGDLIYKHGFEDGPGLTGGMADAQGWTVNTATGPVNWALSATGDGGSSAFQADDLPEINDTTVVSPMLSLPSGVGPLALRFWNSQTIESNAPGCYDSATLDIAVGGGAFTQVADTDIITGNYTGPTSGGFGHPLPADTDAWCGDPMAGTVFVVNADMNAGSDVQYGFRMTSDNSVGRTPDGWSIDNVRITGCQAP